MLKEVSRFSTKKELIDYIQQIEIKVKHSTPNIEQDLVRNIVLDYIHPAKDEFKVVLNKKTTKKEELLNLFVKNEILNNGIQNVQSINTIEMYQFPEESYEINYYKNKFFDDISTQWVNEEQYDDIITEHVKKTQDKFDKLRSIVLPEQRSFEWFEMRKNKITASDLGSVLGLNKHQSTHEYIIKKVFGSDFTGNVFCYHGKKYESIATKIYEYRMNVKIEEFGLLGHPTIPFLGASPDGICGKYKLDGIHLSNQVGRMLEIKCPKTRSINTTGDIYDNICPAYYFAQVQLQLECCDLDECDFWQCKIHEYSSRDDFIVDTHTKEPFRSKINFNEKGCLIQILPLHKWVEKAVNGKKSFDKYEYDHQQLIYDDAEFIYPEKIEMTPYDCDQWVAETVSKLYETHPGYVFDKVFYWRLDFSHNVTIKRDPKWFLDYLPKIKETWTYIEFFRKNKELLELFQNYLKYIRENNKRMTRVDAMKFIEKLYCKDSETINHLKKLTHSKHDDIKERN
jgi:putative phage-type endonuclease